MTSPAQGTRSRVRAAAVPGSCWGGSAGTTAPSLVPDVLGGLTAAAVVLPKAMAYATVAGLPVQVGLYAALVPPIVYALIGRSPVLSVSTSATIGIPTGQLVVATATLSVLVGAILLAAALRWFLIASHSLSVACVAQLPGQGRCLARLSDPPRRPPPPSSS